MKYEFLTGREILPSEKNRILEQAKFTYSPLGKDFEKQTKTIEDQGNKHVKAIEEQRKQIVESNQKYDYNTKKDNQSIFMI